ncbi:unnamed protein product [Dicrocoelium dendriticum]|nr:unnamed protein product [Dicrocoelium dendriticum]
MNLSIQPPSPFWTDCGSRPTSDAWFRWKTSFLNYLDLISDLPTALTEDKRLKLLRHLLRDEGQRQFDDLGLQGCKSVMDAFNALDGAWSYQMNVFTARYIFSRIHQEAGEPLNDFIARLSRAVRPCAYSSIPQKKIEGCMLTQQLITGIADNRIREGLLQEDACTLTWDRPCELARVKTEISLQSKQFCYTSLAEVARVQSFRQRPTDKVSCYRCGSTSHKANFAGCPARSLKCKNCGKFGHYARCCRSQAVALIKDDDTPECHVTDPTQDNIYSITADSIPSGCVTISVVEPKFPAADIRTVLFLTVKGAVPLEMELDSASPVTIVPFQFYERYLSQHTLHPTSHSFWSYSGNTLTILGFIIVLLQLHSVIADVAVYISSDNRRPLLGRNAMVALHIVPSFDRMLISSVNVAHWQEHYPQLFQKSIGRIPCGVHRIQLKPNAKPIAIGQPRPIPLAKREAVSAALQAMLANDLIEPIDCSEWVHPMVCVMKKDGTVRICNDLQALNKQIVVERFVLPSNDELTVRLAGATVFSKLDLKSAFFHMPLANDSKHLTAFLAPDGLFQYKVLPIGLSSAPAAWQKFMTHALAGIDGHVAYMDDICVFGRSQEEHDARLHKVLQRLSDLNLRLKAEKCLFNAPELQFLGHVISRSGILPSDENIRAISEAPTPKNLTELKSFLGMCSYNLRYLPDFATVADPLRQLTKKKSSFVWGSNQQNAFDELKRRVVSAPLVAIFDESCRTFVSTDASDVGLGAVLSQIQNGEEKVIAYASRKLSDSERHYSVGEKEALACVWACEKWHLFLFGRRFILRTDHSALTALLSNGSKGCRPMRIARWYARLLNYDFEIVYRPGLQNQIADGLSRLPVGLEDEKERLREAVLVSSLGANLPALTIEELRRENSNDALLHEIIEYVQQGWPKYNKIPGEFIPYYAIRHELSVVDGCLMRGSVFVAPSQLIAKIIACAHEGHPGTVRTKNRVRLYFWWPRMASSIETFVVNCNACRLADKSSLPVKAPTQPIAYPLKPWTKIAIDIMGPFATAPTNKRNLLVATCFYSRWPEVHMCDQVTTSVVLRWLKHLFSRFGLPHEIVTDNGPQFCSREFADFLHCHNIKHSRTAPYNPAANGMVERLNRSLKEAIQAIHIGGSDWEDAVLTAVFSYRTCDHRATGRTPAELMLGRPLRTKLNAAHNVLSARDAEVSNRIASYQNSYAKLSTPMQPGTYVRVGPRER